MVSIYENIWHLPNCDMGGFDLPPAVCFSNNTGTSLPRGSCHDGLWQCSSELLRFRAQKIWLSLESLLKHPAPGRKLSLFECSSTSLFICFFTPDIRGRGKTHTVQVTSVRFLEKFRTELQIHNHRHKNFWQKKNQKLLVNSKDKKIQCTRIQTENM